MPGHAGIPGMNKVDEEANGWPRTISGAEQAANSVQKQVAIQWSAVHQEDGNDKMKKWSRPLSKASGIHPSMPLLSSEGTLELGALEIMLIIQLRTGHVPLQPQ